MSGHCFNPDKDSLIHNESIIWGSESTEGIFSKYKFQKWQDTTSWGRF